MKTSETKQVSNNQFFSFDTDKVQQITLAQLERTHKEDDVYGNPLKGIYHFALLQQVINMCHEFNYGVEIYDMFAAQNRDKTAPGVVLLPQVEAVYGKSAVEAHILRRVFANIRLTDFDDHDHTTNLAVAFHQQGIQVGFGNMVKICHNQCMLNRSHYAATYSDRGKGRGEGMSLEQIFETIRTWFTNAKESIYAERKKIGMMKEMPVSPDKLLQFIGLLTTMRVKADTLNKEIREHRTYPLSQTQINKFTESLLVKAKDKEQLTVWDLYDASTELYKPDAMEMPNLIPQNRVMVETLDDFFALPILE